MSRGARTALVVVLALCCTVLGALGAAALHWNVVQPSDDELRNAARGVSLSGFVDRGPRVISGKWAPELARGGVHWDAVTDRAVTVDDLATELRTQGWTVATQAKPTGFGTVSGERAPYYLSASLRRGDDDLGSMASVYVSRGQVTPSLATTVWLGVAAGGAIGVCVGLLLARGYDRRRPRRPWIPSAVRYGAPPPPPT